MEKREERKRARDEEDKRKGRGIGKKTRGENGEGWRLKREVKEEERG